ncbi:MAG: hypothetical protein ABJA66_22025 [Actinomycetota bacterium]
MDNPAKELDPTIRTWHKVFNYYQIPPAHVILDRLYLRALDTRQTFLQNGRRGGLHSSFIGK